MTFACVAIRKQFETMHSNDPSLWEKNWHDFNGGAMVAVLQQKTKSLRIKTAQTSRTRRGKEWRRWIRKEREHKRKKKSCEIGISSYELHSSANRVSGA